MISTLLLNHSITQCIFKFQCKNLFTRKLKRVALECGTVSHTVNKMCRSSLQLKQRIITQLQQVTDLKTRFPASFLRDFEGHHGLDVVTLELQLADRRPSSLPARYLTLRTHHELRAERGSLHL